MSIDKRWLPLVAVAACALAGAAVVSKSRRDRARSADDLDHRTQLKSWDSEGGNLAPAASETVLP